MHLRPYQTQLVTEIRGQYQLGRKAVLAVLPTGGGKTVCFSYIAQAASIKGNRVLILVHRAELLDQASRAMPVPHGIIAAGRAMDLSHTVQVASVQTVARRLHLLPRDFFQLLVVDEAHHTTAGTWAKVIAHFHAAKLLGVTATPIRGDGRGLGEHYQAMVQGPTAATANQMRDYLAPARCWHRRGSIAPGCVSGWVTSTPSKPSNVSAPSWATALGITANTYPARRRSHSAAALHMQRQWLHCSSRLVSLRPASTAPWTLALGGSCSATSAPVGSRCSPVVH
jgi:hypothetical protein